MLARHHIQSYSGPLIGPAASLSLFLFRIVRKNAKSEKFSGLFGLKSERDLLQVQPFILTERRCSLAIARFYSRSNKVSLNIS